ncbi:MAG: CDP-alcohol phosphatidyltransferase family protein [Deltaproteobacteria bacterium]|nr:CDP-alcohol phosphatidyltransferase family protein [Deltaproteobacteria bacterium]
MTIRTALIICPEDDNPWIKDRRLLGLTVGERIMLALETIGVKRVAFVGTGPRPTSSRTNLEVLLPEECIFSSEENAFVLLTADLTFDRKLLDLPEEMPDNLPVRCLPVSEWSPVASATDKWLERLGSGSDVSGNGFAVRVKDRQSALAAKRSLLLSLRKPADGVVSRNLNRHVSLFFTRFLIRTGIRPNQLTVFIMAMGILSGVMAAFAEPWWTLVLAGLFFQGQSIFDGCDGEIARLTYRFSYAGQWLDTIGDDITNYLFFLGLTIGQARMHDLPWLYVAGGVTFLFQWGLSFIMYQRIYKMGTGDLLAIPDVYTKGDDQVTGLFGKVVGILRIVTKRDVFALVIATVTAAQMPLVALAAMGIGTYPAFWGIAVNELKLRKMEREGQSTSPE